VLSLRYASALEAIAPRPAAWVMLAVIWAAIFAPLLTIILPSLRERLRTGDG
jgi:hypothetical protein